jgi:HD-GYP domain-containing protein (c-di-GMP phosphodiesterase class II)
MHQNLQAIVVNVMYGKSVSLRDHSLQTAEISAMLASHLLNNGVAVDYSPSEAYSAGLIHDIGKMFISEAILDKPESLTVRETETMRLHTSWGLQFVESVGLGRYSQVVSQHHENAHGTGYPLGLRGESLDQLTRVVHIADLLSALLEDRPYHFILTSLEQDLEGLFNGTSSIIRQAIVDYMVEFRRQRKNVSEVLRFPRVITIDQVNTLERISI